MRKSKLRDGIKVDTSKKSKLRDRTKVDKSKKSKLRDGIVSCANSPNCEMENIQIARWNEERWKISKLRDGIWNY